MQSICDVRRESACRRSLSFAAGTLLPTTATPSTSRFKGLASHLNLGVYIHFLEEEIDPQLLADAQSAQRTPQPMREIIALAVEKGIVGKKCARRGG